LLLIHRIPLQASKIKLGSWIYSLGFSLHVLGDGGFGMARSQTEGAGAVSFDFSLLWLYSSFDV